MSNLGVPEIDSFIEFVKNNFDEYQFHHIIFNDKEQALSFVPSLSFVTKTDTGLKMPPHMVGRTVTGEKAAVILIAGELTIEESLEICEKCKRLGIKDDYVGVGKSQGEIMLNVTEKLKEKEVISAAKSKAANKKVFLVLGIVFGGMILLGILCAVIISIGNIRGSVVSSTSPTPPSPTPSFVPTSSPTQIIVTFSVDVDARTATWFDTGISIQKSDEISIVVSGTIDFGGVQSGPGGSSEIQPGSGVVPTAPYGALLGVIGSGEPFIVGSNFQMKSLNDGVLMFLINDVPEQYNDNSGQYHVIITITKNK